MNFIKQLSFFTFTLLSATALLPDTPPLCKISDIGANLSAHPNIARIGKIIKLVVHNLT